MVSRIKESQGNPGPPPQRSWGRDLRRSYFLQKLVKKGRASAPPGAFDVGEMGRAPLDGASAPEVWGGSASRPCYGYALVLLPRSPRVDAFASG